MATKRDSRKWLLVSEYLGNDDGPYTTRQIMDYAQETNRENGHDQEYVPFDLVDAGDEILDLSHQPGNEGRVVAILWKNQ